MITRQALTLSTVLSGVAMIPALCPGLLSSPARAADTSGRTTDASSRTPHAATAPKTARKAPAKKEVRISRHDEAITVFGHGSTRQMTSITHSMMLQSAPGTSPLKVLSQLPGVVYQSADPFGAYEYSSQIFMRGFSQSQLGFTLDDIPLGDQ
ncbi:TonB-dependent receptor plug domain-containing protein [Gluconobacter roseus]|uniref:TonB-dependent receptor plug domain-containing protein n=1 Tax=Gluconobacter roseus NBRC 3990 TaxID=1307950 RepID=A0A4Y3M9H0_9PROT|nr:Plug domain-containing protein [Gluconobacter roseus]GBR47403.1 hypothetical protein AA3990_1776 [Gluconobacter roseus NBRC 3990]GEB04566.1 hypothetical protein GRO01_21420 [Gluconobacter roseus NBRC 3990]GLP92299.1 hypothetical protein GCM10007871_02770 [Gluconobacter roseus NBRC 3990]